MDASGRVALFVNTGAHLVVDVVGWFPGPSTSSAALACTGTFVDPRQTRQLALSSQATTGCALSEDSNIVCWLRGGLTPYVYASGVGFPISGTLVEIARAQGQVCALRTDGSVACSYPQFGAFEIPLGEPIVDIVGFGNDAGFSAIEADGDVSCWTPMAPPSPNDITHVPTTGRAKGFVQLSFRSGPIAVVTDAGTADVLVRQPDNRFAVAWTSSEAVPGRPWSTVVQAQAGPAGDMCLVLVDGRATCGSSGDLAPDFDVVWNDGAVLRDAGGSAAQDREVRGRSLLGGPGRCRPDGPVDGTSFGFDLPHLCPC